MKHKPSYHEIAADWRLWQQHVDTVTPMPEETFHCMTVPEKVGILGECFGPEQVEEAEQVSTHTSLEEVAPLIGSALGRLRFTVPGDALILPTITAAIAKEKARAAYPDLLDACQKALAVLWNPCSDEFDSDQVEQLLVRVIAKAGGGK